MKKYFAILVMAIALIFLSSCFFFKIKDNFPDVNGWWELTVNYKDCYCSNGEICPSGALLTIGIAFPSTRVLRVEFFFDEQDEVLHATFYEGTNHLFSLNGNLEDTGDFTVEGIINGITVFFDGSFEGDVIDGRTEMDYQATSEIDCHAWGLFTGGRS